MPHSLMFDGPAGAGVDAGVNPIHDLKTLLAVILRVCQSLVDGRADPAEQIELARAGLRAAERAGALLDRIQASTPGPVPAQRAPALETESRTVLVVEDEPDLLRLMTAAFARAGFKAYGAHDGRLAAKLLEALRPDLIVTDIVMPQKDGIGVILEAKRISPGSAVIAISGGGSYGRSGRFLQWASELGADKVLAKPFSMAQLLTAADTVLDRKARAGGIAPAD